MIDLLLGRYKFALDALVIALVVGAMAFGVHHYNAYQQGIGESRNEAVHVARELAAQQASRAREIQLQKDKDDAVAEAAKNRQALAAVATAAANSGRVLDSTLQAIRAAAPGYSASAAREYAATLATVLNECQTAYRGVAAEADGHAADSLMLQNSWPN